MNPHVTLIMITCEYLMFNSSQPWHLYIINNLGTSNSKDIHFQSFLQIFGRLSEYLVKLIIVLLLRLLLEKKHQQTLLYSKMD